MTTTSRIAPPGASAARSSPVLAFVLALAGCTSGAATVTPGPSDGHRRHVRDTIRRGDRTERQPTGRPGGPAARSSSRSPVSSTSIPSPRIRFAARVDGRHVVLTITYTSGVEPCSVLDTIVVERGDHSFAITLREGHGPGNQVCIMIARVMHTQVDLGELDPGTYTITDTMRWRRPDRGGRQLTLTRWRRAATGRLCDDPAVNLLDLFAVALAIAALILGARSGAIPQVGGLLGAIGGAALAILVLPALADPLSGVDPSLRPFLVIGGLIGTVALGESIGAGVGRWLIRGVGQGLLSNADRAAGAVLGVAQALLIVWLSGGLLAEGPFPTLAQSAGTSTIVRTLSSVLPPPTELAVELRTWLDASGPAGRVHRLRAAAGAAGRAPGRPGRPGDRGAGRGERAQGLGRDLRAVVGRDGLRDPQRRGADERARGRRGRQPRDPRRPPATDACWTRSRSCSTRSSTSRSSTSRAWRSTRSSSPRSIRPAGRSERRSATRTAAR